MLRGDGDFGGTLPAKSHFICLDASASLESSSRLLPGGGASGTCTGGSLAGTSRLTCPGGMSSADPQTFPDRTLKPAKSHCQGPSEQEDLPQGGGDTLALSSSLEYSATFIGSLLQTEDTVSLPEKLESCGDSPMRRADISPGRPAKLSQDQLQAFVVAVQGADMGEGLRSDLLNILSDVRSTHTVCHDP
mmetsp:Transcript_2858/g.8444  ORF Transcript_2858/g.8444 Transcript_2858/m.8444 type:complete len:190 (-) Transcript_2858:8-577(-)